VLAIFEIGSGFMLGMVWTAVFVFLFLSIAEMTGVYHQAQPLVESGSHESFAWVALKPQSF
jgi:hypothetical protein